MILSNKGGPKLNIVSHIQVFWSSGLGWMEASSKGYWAGFRHHGSQAVLMEEGRKQKKID